MSPDRASWIAFAVWMGHGVCDGCGRLRYLARQPRRQKRECLDCYTAGAQPRRRAA